MIEIRFHGRGGQGAVTSAEVLAHAAIEEGLYAQAIPSFGPERRGAPVTAYARIASEPIKVRTNVYEPDYVIVLDPSLLGLPSVRAGLKPDGTIVANTQLNAQEVRKVLGGYLGRLALVDATGIAMRVLRAAITNTAMLGALARASGILGIEAFVEPLKARFGRAADRNIQALRTSYEETSIFEGPLADSGQRRVQNEECV